MRTAIRLIPAFAVAFAVTACDSKKPAPKTDEAPKAEAPKAEAPKAEAPKAEAPKAEAPKAPADTTPKGEPSTTLPPKGEPSTTLPPKPPAGAAPAAPAAGEQVLFDGKTLKNWKVADFAGGGKVEVKDGAIVIGMGEPMTGIVWSGGEIPKMDYEISLEAKKVDGSDFFCALTFPYGKKTCTFVCGGWGGIVTGLSTIDGFDASDNETTNTKEFKANTWYKIRVRATEEEIECWINGEQLVDVETKEKQIDIRLECEPCVPLGVATFQTTGALRNLRMKKVN